MWCSAAYKNANFGKCFNLNNPKMVTDQLIVSYIVIYSDLVI